MGAREGSTTQKEEERESSATQKRFVAEEFEFKLSVLKQNRSHKNDDDEVS